MFDLNFVLELFFFCWNYITIFFHYFLLIYFWFDKWYINFLIGQGGARMVNNTPAGIPRKSPRIKSIGFGAGMGQGKWIRNGDGNSKIGPAPPRCHPYIGRVGAHTPSEIITPYAPSQLYAMCSHSMFICLLFPLKKNCNKNYLFWWKMKTSLCRKRKKGNADSVK